MGPPFPTHLWVEFIISLEFIMAPIQLSCGMWWVIPSLSVSSGFCSVIKSQTYPLSPHWQFSSFGSGDGIFIVWQWTNSTDVHGVCSHASPPFCRGRTELLLAFLRCFLWLRPGMLLMSDAVAATNNLDSSFEVFQEWASRRSSASFFFLSQWKVP